MAEITLWVDADLDDGQRSIDSVSDPWEVYDTKFEAGYEGSGDQKKGAAARWLNVAIQAGATITQANLILDCRIRYEKTVVNTRLRAQAHINPSTFVDDAGADFDSRSWTTAYVNWDAIAVWEVGVAYTSPDIKSCIQEVIDLPNWASGNPIVILWDDFEQRSTQVSVTLRRADSYEGGQMPKLVITFTPPSPSVTTDAATGITAVLATLNGTLDNDGGDPDGADCCFEWGLNTTYGNTTATQNKTTGQTFEQAFTDLLPNTIYHFRAKATNEGGTSYGADATFHTLGNTGYVISGLEGTIRHISEEGIYRLEIGLGGHGRGFRIIGYTHSEAADPESPPDYSEPLEVAPGPDVCAMAAEAYSRWQSTSMNPPIMTVGEQRAEETRARERYGAGTEEFRAWAVERMNRWAAERRTFEGQVNTLWNTYNSLNAACSLTKSARGGATGSRHSATIEELHRGRRPLKDWVSGQTEGSVRSLARSPFAAHSILKADTAGVPESLTVAEQRLVGRITSGVITGLTPAQIMALLSGQAGAAFDWGGQNLTNLGDLTTSGSFISLGGTPTRTGKFLTGSAGFTVLAFSGDNFDIRAGSGGSYTQNVMRVTSAKDVGIGTNNPGAKLEVLKEGNQLKLSFDGTDNAIFAVDTNGVLTITPSGAAIDFASKKLTGIDLQNQSFENLLSNGSFENGDPPIGWTAAACTLAQEGTIVKVGSKSLKLTTTVPAVAAVGYQAVGSYGRYLGREVTLGAWVYLLSANTGTNIGRLQIYDGVGASYTDYATADDAWHWMTVTQAINANATQVRAALTLDSDVGDIVYCDGAILVEGESCPAFSPRPSVVVWKDASEQAMSDLNRTTTLTDTDLDLTAYTSATAKFAILELKVELDSHTGAFYNALHVRKNGTTPTWNPQVQIDSRMGDTVGAYHMVQRIVALDAGQVIEYRIYLSGTVQMDSYINVLGYIE